MKVSQDEAYISQDESNKSLARRSASLLRVFIDSQSQDGPTRLKGQILQSKLVHVKEAH